MPMVFRNVEDLEAGKGKFGMQLRLIRHYEVPTFGSIDEAFSLECIFHDKMGVRIHGSIQRALIPKFKPNLEEGKLYAVMDYIVGKNTMKFKTTNSKFKLLIFKQTRICEVGDDDFPMQLFNFKNFEAIQSANNNDDGGVMFDVIGIVNSPYKSEPKEVNGRTLRLCTITLEDLEGRTLRCTLWEEYAHKAMNFLRKESGRPVAMIVQFCRTHCYRGDISVTNSFCATNIIFEGNFPELEEIEKKYLETSNDGRAVVPFSVDEDYKIPLKTISQLQNDGKIGKFWINATIFSLETIGAWAYLACTICFSKLKPDSQKFYCEKCDTTEISGRYRYKLTLRVTDDDGTSAFHLWDKECLSLIGKSAADLNTSGELEEIPPEIEELEGKRALFMVKVKDGQTMTGAYNVIKIISEEYEIMKFHEIQAQLQGDPEVLFGNDKEVSKGKEAAQTNQSVGDGGEADTVKVHDEHSVAVPKKKSKILIKKEK